MKHKLQLILEDVYTLIDLHKFYLKEKKPTIGTCYWVFELTVICFKKLVIKHE